MKSRFAASLCAIGLSVGLTHCSKLGLQPKTENNFRQPVSEEAFQKSYGNAEKSQGVAGKLGSDYRFSEYVRDFTRLDGPAGTANRDDLVHRKMDVQSYHLTGKFDWTTGFLTAAVRIEVLPLESLAAKGWELDCGVSEILAVRDGADQLRTWRYDPEKKLLAIEWTPADEQTIGLTDTATILNVQYRVEAGSNLAGLGNASASLKAVTPRAGDPVNSRVVSTFSEPMGARDWMPSNDHPSDRAKFSVDFRMDGNERLISNGDLQLDQVDVHGIRQVKYATTYSLPTYLMAFAQGDFASATTQLGSLPVSVWYRKGLPMDATGVLANLSAMIGHFQTLVGPYPFEKYSLVLLPEFRGGIEHAGITFQGETSSSRGDLASDFGLTAHELGHQWFGDYITVQDWDDIWIKEGMATLLAEEAGRMVEDQNKRGHLLGSNFWPEAGAALRDRALSPDQKYTSGPYDRAAWFWTQLRTLTGEEVFWSTLRGILADYAYGNVNTDDIFKAFAPHLSAATLEKARLAIDAKAIPSIEAAFAETAGLTLSVVDSEQTLLVPLEVAELSENGQRTTQLLDGSTRASHQWSVSNSLIAVEPRDVHPVFPFAKDEATLTALLSARSAPKSAAQMVAFTKFHPALQKLAFRAGSNWALNPAEFSSVMSTLGSESVRIKQVTWGCAFAKSLLPEGAAAVDPWKSLLMPPLLAPKTLGFVTYSGDMTNLSDCYQVFGAGIWGRQLQALELQIVPGDLTETNLVEIGALGLDPVKAFPIWQTVLRQGPSIRAKVVALNQLNRHVRQDAGFAPPAESDLPQWKSLFRTTLADAHASELLQSTVLGLVLLKDVDALPVMGQMVHRWNKIRRAMRTFVCSARAISGGDQGQWQSFVDAVGSTADLPGSISELILHPEGCGN